MRCFLPARALGALLLCVALSSCSGCASRSSFSSSAQPLLIVAIDRTVPGTAAREAQVTQLDSILKSAVEAHYPVDIWCYDSAPIHLWGPGVPASDDQLDPIVEQKAAPVPPSSPRTGRPDRVVAVAVSGLAPTAYTSGRIFLLTDGAVSQSSNPPDPVAAIASLLAMRPGWRIAVLDITAKNRALWASDLAPLGTRCEFLDERHTTAMLSQNRDM